MRLYDANKKEWVEIKLEDATIEVLLKNLRRLN